MLRQIRNGVFETNSSSTHTLSIYKKEDLEKFKKSYDSREILFDEFSDKTFYTREEKYKEYEEECAHDNINIEPSDDDFYEWCQENGFCTYEDYYERYEILEENIPESDYVAVSIYGYE